MKYVALLLICALGAALPAKAAVTVEEDVLQKGTFVKSGCKSAPLNGKEDKYDIDAHFDACSCEADVRYPVLSGMTNAVAQSAFNDSFRQSAEKAECEGEAKPATADAKKPEKFPSSRSYHYDVTFQSPSLLGFKFMDWIYTGGAHDSGTVTGVIIDLEKGKTLSIGDLIASANMPAVNQAIYDALTIRPSAEIFGTQIENRKGKFITGAQCQGCILTLDDEGIKVVFQAYEVGSGAEGNIEVPIPAKYISYPAVVQALAAQKTTAEKK